MLRRWATALSIAAASTVVAWGTPAAAGFGETCPATGPGDGPSNRAFVLHLSQHSPYALVRAAAHAAYTSDRPDNAAIKEFIPNGYEQTVRKLQDEEPGYDHLIARLLRTHTAGNAPAVVQAAQSARDGDLVAKRVFAKAGYAQALATDGKLRRKDEANQKAIKDSDRKYVQDLAGATTTAVGRAAAAATASGATDHDLVEFFHYTWSDAAGVDTEAGAAGLAAKEVQQIRSLGSMQDSACAAKRLADAATGEDRPKLREKAAELWTKVVAESAHAHAKWAEARLHAAVKTNEWEKEGARAKQEGGPNWSKMELPASNQVTAWRAIGAGAPERATFWDEVGKEANRYAKELSRP